jgi:enoyl-CoA hydratase/carnithine racemase
VADYETLIYEERDHVAWITLNRPEVLNSFNMTMVKELGAVWTRVATSSDVRCAVLTGTGRAFCVGLDRTDFFDTGESLELNVELAPKAKGCWKPVIAAVNGMAAAGAFYMLGEADILICSEGATFFDSHVTFGMVSGHESMHMVQRMPFGEVVRMQLLGNYERLSARRALEVGLVSEVVPGDELLAAAGRLARIVAAQEPSAIEGTLRALWAARSLPRQEAFDLMPTIFSGVGAGDALNENRTYATGQADFVAKKRVEWTLR